jgi:hypothetical protein
MRPFLFGLSISISFILGAVFSHTLTRPAQAQSGARSQWEYYCIEKFNDSPERLMQAFAAGGLKGWELAAAGEYMPVVVPTTGTGQYPVRPVVWCFKRPLR